MIVFLLITVARTMTKKQRIEKRKAFTENNEDINFSDKVPMSALSP